MNMDYWEDFAKTLNEAYTVLQEFAINLAVMYILFPKETEEAIRRYEEKEMERYKEYLERNSRWML